MKITMLIDRLLPRPRASARLRSLSARDIRRFLQESGLTFCELLTLGRGANGSEQLLHERLEMIGLNANDIDLTALNSLLNSPATLDNTSCAMPATWPSPA